MIYLDKVGPHTPKDHSSFDVLRPRGYMENPYKGKDGKDYNSYGALLDADRDFVRMVLLKR